MGRYDKYSRNPRRLQGYDYGSEGLYFITICTKDRWPFFGEVRSGEMILSDAGVIVRDCWLQIPHYHPEVLLGEFVVMPNHVHGILELERVGPLPTSATSLCYNDATTEAAGEKNHYMADLSSKAGSISRIVGSYKRSCTIRVKEVGVKDFSWQSRFHDHIIRNQQELEKIENYIVSNPAKWADDKFHL
ncbi:transposase [Cesiribacter sp. SM1]|uniref:transposase n=1 Tax=Cesiribacter sp. SM1 TaxID=2861196 RepID=UPI001CD38705|nr:transposase [Cesiribacter sp. SM1]